MKSTTILNTVIICLILFIVVMCKPKDCTYNLNNFNSFDWKEDSLGCLKKRGTLYKELKSKKGSLLNKTDCQINYLLGAPNIIRHYKNGETDYYYYIEAGAQCTPSLLDTPSVGTLYILFDKQNKVIKIGTQFP